ncbi:glycosyltransferase [Okeania sp.]|uniref:glycosyltransferase n=1 Tax=Okeania sp. TaxID=3100323 RepID=UPI002B4B1396|nr:glycosyltransferase [Okeania sp.]MEB3342541.1 glycosyltransferase [Okeania sp.]
MKIGYLHISLAGSKSGVTRYGHFLASAARKQSHLDILETDVELTTNTTNNLKLLSQAAKKLSEADVVHIQFNIYTWGKKWQQFQNIKAFINNCQAPIVATIHDVLPANYPPYSLLEAFQREYYQQRKYSNFQKLSLRSTINNFWNNYISHNIPNIYTIRWLLKKVKLVITCTKAESQRLIPYSSRKLVNIFHFVEERNISISPPEARSILGLEKFKVITLQGFIFRSKGHRLLIEAMPKLSENIKVVFAGEPAPNQENFWQELLKLAEKIGVADRLLVTGYLSEKDLETYLMASHLAVCPFEILSASGSLSTWISLARPILASDLPQIAEYNKIEPGAIQTFQPYTAEALAEAIKEELSMVETEEKPNDLLISLREKLSISNIFNQHLKVYQNVVKNH